MYQLLLRIFYHPVLFFFSLPLFYMALGVLFSIPFDSIRILSVIFLYLFILLNQMLENMVLRLSDKEKSFSKPFFLVLEGLNILTILYFGWRHSWTAALVLIGYTLIIQLQFLLDYYEMERFSVTITSVFKVFLLNGFAFYIGTNFMHVPMLPIFTGLLFPFFILEASRMGRQGNAKSVQLFLGLSYLLGILLLWNHVGQMSLALLLSLPFAWLVFKKYNRQTASTFSIFFAFIYILIMASSIT